MLRGWLQTGSVHSVLSSALKRACRCVRLPYGNHVLCEDRATLPGAPGRVHQFAGGSDEFINGFRRKRRLAVDRADPGIDVGSANGNAIVTVRKSGRAPLFGDTVFATDRGRSC